jgi:hypothetical protein
MPKKKFPTGPAAAINTSRALRTSEAAARIVSAVPD